MKNKGHFVYTTRSGAIYIKEYKNLTQLKFILLYVYKKYISTYLSKEEIEKINFKEQSSTRQMFRDLSSICNGLDCGYIDIRNEL